jgi:murein hydrolase activator
MFCVANKIFKRLIFSFIMVALPNMAIAAGDKGDIPGESLKNYREQAERLSRKIDLSQKDLERLLQEEKAVLNILNKIDINLAACRNQILAYRSELSELEKELQKAEIISMEQEKRVDSLREYAKKRLVAIYKMNRLGTLSMLASADSFSEFLFRKKALERIFIHDEEIIKILAHEQARLNDVLTEIGIRKNQKIELERDLNKEIAGLALERKKRGDILAEIRRKKSLEQELIEAYQQAAVDLNNAIESLNTKNDDSGLAKFTSDNPFEAFKGLLNMPVNGTIRTRFGSYRDKRLNVERFNSGISVSADRGEPIHAVKDGLILYAGWFKGYGKMIIIDHGHHFYTVYAHAEELFKDKGDPVESGEVIATVGDSGSISGPELYFEVRHYGKPVDPLEWIRKG